MKNNENIEKIENGESHIERDIKNAKEILERMNPNQKINYRKNLLRSLTNVLEIMLDLLRMSISRWIFIRL